MLTRWLLYPYAHTLYCTKYHKIPVNGYSSGALARARGVPASPRPGPPSRHRSTRAGRAAGLCTGDGPPALGERAAPPAVVAALARSKVSRRINTSFLERQNATDRQHNAQKVRKTSTFSKAWRVYEAMTYFTMYNYDLCLPIRTLDERDEQRVDPTVVSSAAIWT